MVKTPSEVTYNAWKQTKQIMYHTKDAKGNDLDVSVKLLPPESNADYSADADGVCAICGGHVAGGVPVKKMLGSSYTDWAIHKAPDSQWICKHCAWAMMMNTENGRQSLFRYSFFASNAGLKICNRAELRDGLIDPPDPPFVAVIAVSQKKHLITKASVSYGRDRYYCMLEEECIQVSRDTLEKQVMAIESLRGLGCVREEIENASFRYDKLQSWGAENLERAVSILIPWIKQRQFQIALHVAQKKEDERLCKSYLGFQPLT